MNPENCWVASALECGFILSHLNEPSLFTNYLNHSRLRIVSCHLWPRAGHQKTEEPAPFQRAGRTVLGDRLAVPGRGGAGWEGDGNLQDHCGRGGVWTVTPKWVCLMYSLQ